jgi:hypothetical protein
MGSNDMNEPFEKRIRTRDKMLCIKSFGIDEYVSRTLLKIWNYLLNLRKNSVIKTQAKNHLASFTR